MDRRWTGAPRERADADRQTASLGGLAIVLALLVLGLLLFHELRVKSAVEDCLLLGRRDCDTVLVARH